MTKSETGCCKRFDPKPWREKEIVWKDKLFVRDTVASFLHIPLNFGAVVVRNMEKIKAAGAEPKVPLMLADEGSLWRSELHIAVKKPVPGARMEKLSGRFLSKVFEGPYSQAGKWVAEMKEYSAGKGKRQEKLYFFYTTCPKCAQAYGKNYVVALAKVG